jgi:hypothetical protein
MSRTAAARRPTAVKHSLIQTAVLLLVVSGFSWNCDGWLLMRMKIIADDALSFGSCDRPMLLLDDGDELRTYSPSRIAEFVRFPAASIRAVAFLSLAERQEDRDGAPWVGVAPTLIDAYLGEDDQVVRECARNALANLPLIPAEDVDAVATFLEETRVVRDVDVRASLLGRLVAADSGRKSWAVRLCEHWLNSSDAEERRLGFRQLSAIAPECTETAAAFRKLMKGGDPDRIAASAGRTILRHHPALIDECLAGNETERRFIAQCAAEERRLLATHASKASVRAVFSDVQLHRVQKLPAPAPAVNAAISEAEMRLRQRGLR